MGGDKPELDTEKNITTRKKVSSSSSGQGMKVLDPDDFKDQLRQEIMREMKSHIEKIGDSIVEQLDKRLDSKLKNLASVFENRFVLMESLLTSTVKRVTEVEKELADLKRTSTHVTAQNQPTPPPNDSASLSKSIRDELFEQRRRMEKQNNVIVFGLSEHADANIEEQNLHKLIYCCDSTTRIIPKSFKRLGKPSERPRPILVELETLYFKNRVLKGKAYLKTRPQYKQVFIAHDLTIRQREERKQYALAKSQHPSVPPPPLQ
jgi:hypothetical protein